VRTACSPLITVTPGPVVSFELVASPSNLSITGSTIITVSGKDTFGNTVITDNSTTFNVNIDTDAVASSLVGTLSGGLATFTVTKPTAGLVTVSANRSGVIAGTGAVTFTALPVTPTPDTTAPIISAINAVATSTTAASYNFITNETATGVIYVSTGSTVSSSVYTFSGSTNGTNHTGTLSGLAAGTQYYYVIVATDASANATTTLAGTFTTASPVVVVTDTTAPTLISSTPSNAATSVSASAGTASIKYSESLTLVDASKVLIRKASDLSSVASSTGTVSTDTLSINYGALEYGTSYRLTVLSGAISDIAGNNVLGDADIYFTTQSASAPDITGLSVGTVSSTSAVVTYSTDVVPTTSQYRISTSAYAGTWSTLAGSPANFTGLTANTLYYFQVRFTQNGQTVNSVPMSFRTAASATGIAITGISQIPHGTPVVGGDYTNGYHFRFNVTANNLTETGATFKLADWSNTATTLAVSGNAKMVISQDGVSDYATGSGSAVAVTNAYGTAVNIASMDADTTTGGRQFSIDLFYKIPVGAAGVYSTSYGILTQ
jgi:hypothetical protein